MKRCLKTFCKHFKRLSQIPCNPQHKCCKLKWECLQSVRKCNLPEQQTLKTKWSKEQSTLLVKEKNQKQPNISTSLQKFQNESPMHHRPKKACRRRLPCWARQTPSLASPPFTSFRLPTPFFPSSHFFSSFFHSSLLRRSPCLSYSSSCQNEPFFNRSHLTHHCYL